MSPIMVIPQPSAQVRSGAHARNLQRIREALEHSMRDATPEEVAAARRDLDAYTAEQLRLARVQAVLPLASIS